MLPYRERQKSARDRTPTSGALKLSHAGAREERPNQWTEAIPTRPVPIVCFTCMLSCTRTWLSVPITEPHDTMLAFLGLPMTDAILY